MAAPVITVDPMPPQCDIPLIMGWHTAKMPSVIVFTLAVSFYLLNGLWFSGGQTAINSLIPFFFILALVGGQIWVIWAQAKFFNKCSPVNWIGIVLACIVGILSGSLGYWGAYWASGNTSMFNIVAKADLSQADILSQAKTINDQATADAASAAAAAAAQKAAADKAARNQSALDKNRDILIKSGYEFFSNSTPFAINNRAATLNSSGKASAAAFLAAQSQAPQQCSAIGTNGVMEVELVKNGQVQNSIVAEPIA
jgi:hypothetical protein